MIAMIIIILMFLNVISYSVYIFLNEISHQHLEKMTLNLLLAFMQNFKMCDAHVIL